MNNNQNVISRNSRQIVYDLTEVHMASTGKQRHHGIVRVVAEIGAELSKLDSNIKYAVFSHGYKELYEVNPKTREDDTVELDLPSGIRQWRTRTYEHTELRDIFRSVAKHILDKKNRSEWSKIARNMTPINMNGKTLLSCASPKHIADIMHALDNKNISYELVPMLHDMIPLHDINQGKNHGIYVKRFIADNRYVVSKSRAIIANSKYTCGEIIHYSKIKILPTLPEIFTVQLAHESPRGIESSVYMPIYKQYLLMVGSNLGRKNLEVALEAMLILTRNRKKSPLLVLAGVENKKIYRYLSAEKYRNILQYIVYRFSPNQTDMNVLYKNALALIIPSRMEGWGLPAGEALWHNVPVICSNADALKEVCGSVGLYFDPDNAEQLAEYITRLLDDPDYLNMINRKIELNHLLLRSWSDVANDMLNIIYSLE